MYCLSGTIDSFTFILRGYGSLKIEQRGSLGSQLDANGFNMSFFELMKVIF
jgi:hypothetical protein